MPYRYLKPMLHEMERQKAQSKLDEVMVNVVSRASRKNFVARRILNGWQAIASRAEKQVRRKPTKEEWQARNRAMDIEVIGHG